MKIQISRHLVIASMVVVAIVFIYVSRAETDCSTTKKFGVSMLNSFDKQGFKTLKTFEKVLAEHLENVIIFPSKDYPSDLNLAFLNSKTMITAITLKLFQKI